MIVDQKYYAWKLDASSELPMDHYEFDKNGKMLFEGIIDKGGVLYYYEAGKPVEKGLFKYNGDYYYVQYNGTLIVDTKYYAWKVNENCDLPISHYEFDENGKMLQGIVNKDGVLFYYENGKPTEKGLFILDGYYYYSQYNGTLITNTTYFVWKTNDLLLEKHYVFNELGQIIG